jgi:hypothetical protein
MLDLRRTPKVTCPHCGGRVTVDMCDLLADKPWQSACCGIQVIVDRGTSSVTLTALRAFCLWLHQIAVSKLARKALDFARDVLNRVVSTSSMNSDSGPPCIRPESKLPIEPAFAEQRAVNFCGVHCVLELRQTQNEALGKLCELLDLDS